MTSFISWLLGMDMLGLFQVPLSPDRSAAPVVAAHPNHLRIERSRLRKRRQKKHGRRFLRWTRDLRLIAWRLAEGLFLPDASSVAGSACGLSYRSYSAVPCADYGMVLIARVDPPADSAS